MQIAQREALAHNAEVERLEEALAQARSQAKANGVGVKARLQALQIAYGLSLLASTTLSR